MRTGRNMSMPAWRRVSVLLAMMILCAGCSVFRKAFERTVVVTVHDTRDSIVIRERIVHDTVKVDIPVYVEENVTKDDSSHLENPFAISDAWIRDGLLHHSLRTRGGTIDVPVDVHVADTAISHESYEKKDSIYTKEVYVEKELTWAQKAKIRAFPWILLAAVVLALWTFRKPLVAFVKKCLP